MTTPEIAKRLVALCRAGKYAEVYQELYAPHAKSIEPAGNDFGLAAVVEGLENFPAKGAAFNEHIQEFHSSYVDDPIVAGDYFVVKMGYDATVKGAGRSQLDELAVYHVQDGKVVSEEFFY
ncbi:MAG: nuclear transport factor 2 family protein [Saprospiraceae bacterium]